MNWLLLGIVIAVAGIVAGWAVWVFQSRDAGNANNPLLVVEALRQPDGWIKIFVMVGNQAPDALYVHTIGLTDPPLGDLVEQTSESQFSSGREIAVNRQLPPYSEGNEIPSTTLQLMLDDPVRLIDEIGLTVAVSRESDWSDCVVLKNRTHVWRLPK